MVDPVVSTVAFAVPADQPVEQIGVTRDVLLPRGPQLNQVITHRRRARIGAEVLGSRRQCVTLSAVAILIDEARWWWRGRRWCHLVSDESYDELHEFADRVGIPRRGFQGDHYDVPEEYRQGLIDAGATNVESRELVRRLRGGGLRLSPAQRRARAGAD